MKKSLFRNIAEMRATMFDLARRGFVLHSIDARSGENRWQLHPNWRGKSWREMKQALDVSFTND